MALSMVEDKEKSTCKHNYSLILLDCNMPIMNGYDTCKQLYKLQKAGSISPTIIIAATADVSKSNI